MLVCFFFWDQRTVMFQVSLASTASLKPEPELLLRGARVRHAAAGREDRLRDHRRVLGGYYRGVNHSGPAMLAV